MGSRQWATYYGGSGAGIATDASGNIFVTGQTNSSSGIATSGAYLTSGTAGYTVFIVKFDSTGTRKWGTYYYGNWGSAIATDANGNVCVTGTNGGDVFIVKFNSTGSHQWSANYGGSGNEGGYGIATDANGNICITGWTSSTTGIATSGAYQTAYGGGTYDAFIAKFDAYGTLLWATYYGGAGIDWGYGIAIDAGGNVYATGYTSSITTIATSGAYQVACGGAYDAFIVKFDSYSNRQWATYYGGTGNEQGFAIASDPGGNICIIGVTSSTSGIVSGGTYQSAYSGGTYDVFIVKFNTSGTRKWATYYGGTGEEEGQGIVTDAKGNVCITGYTNSATGIATTGSHQTSYGGNNDAFIAKFVSECPPAPIVTISGTLTFCAGKNVTLNSSTSSGRWTNFQWYKNSTINLSISDSFYSATSSGTYKVFVSNADGCLDSSLVVNVTVYPKPNAGFSQNSLAQCLLGNNFIFNDTSSIIGATLTRLWSFGNGDTSTSVNPSKSYSSVNNYSVKLLETSNNGCQDSVIKIIRVNAKPNAGFTINNNSQCLNGNNFIFDDTSTASSGTLSRTWYFGTGINDTSTSSVSSKTYLSSGTYQVNLISNNQGCKDSAFNSVMVFPKPNVSFSQNNFAQCLSGNNFILNDTSTISSGTISRLWNFGNGNTSTSSVSGKTFASAGTYIIKLFETSDHNCTDSAIKTFTVYPQPAAGFTQNNFTQCLSGNSFILNDTSIISFGNTTRLWRLSTGDTSSSSTLNKNFIQSGTYSVNLIQTSNNNCSDSVSKTFTVYPQTTIGFTQNNFAQCSFGNSFILNDTSTISSGTISRLWNFGDGTISVNNNLNKSFTSAGTYQIKLVEISDHNCIDSIIKYFTVYPQPISGFSQNNFNLCLSGNNFLLTDTSFISSGNTTRLWSFSDGDTSTSSNVVKTFTFPGTYSVRLSEISNKSCKDSTAKTYTVYPQPKAGFTQNLFSNCLPGNNFLLSDTSTISSGTISRLWNFGDGDTSTSSVSLKIFTTAGTYHVKLFETSDHNCIDSAIKIFTVYPQPVAGFTQNNFDRCLRGNNFLLNDTSILSSGTMTRLWNFGDGDTSTISTLNKSFASEGIYNLKLLVTSNNNCSDSVTKIFTVFPQTKIGFSMNSLNQCLSVNRFLFSDTSTISSGSFSRLWDFGDGANSINAVISKRYSVSGLYLVKLETTTNNGCMDSLLKTVLVYPKIIAGFTVDDSVQCLFGNNFLLNDKSIVPGGTYSRYWYLGDATTNTVSDFSKSYIASGNFKVQLKIVDPNNCSDSAIHSILVKPNPVKPQILSLTNTQIQSTFSTNAYQWFLNNNAIANANSQTIFIHQNGIYYVKVDSVNGCSAVSDPLNVTLFGNTHILVIPNPNNGNFILDFIALPGQKQIDLYDMHGKFLNEYSTTDDVFEMNNFLSGGMYLLKVVTETGMYNVKVVVE
ncbi:MAG: PKD domain-containing protein [Bacteroidia bacterium]